MLSGKGGAGATDDAGPAYEENFHRTLFVAGIKAVAHWAGGSVHVDASGTSADRIRKAAASQF